MKERLTGAIILVALIVLLVPELLTGPIRTSTRAQAVASSAEGPPLLSYTIKLGDDARARSAAPAASGPAQPAPLTASAAADPAGTAAAPAPAAASTTPVEPAAPAAATTPPAPPAPAAPPAAGPGGKAAASAPGTGWVVQLGSFASHANAEQLARKVHAQGFTVSVSQGSGGRRLYRVRVGPVADRPAAVQLAQRLRASGHSGAIVPL